LIEKENEMKKVTTIALGVFLGLVLCIVASLAMCSVPLIDLPQKSRIPTPIPLDEYTPSIDLTATPEVLDLGKVEILSFRCYPDPDLPSTSHVVGEIKNRKSKTVYWVKIITTLYDSQGDVTYTDFTYCMPKTLKPGQSCTFDSWMDSNSESIKCRVRVTYK